MAMAPINKKFAIRAGIILLALVVIGWTIAASFSRREGSRTSRLSPQIAAGNMPSPSTLANLYAAGAAAADPKLMEVMGRYRVGPKAAKYIAQGKMQIVGQTDTSIHVTIIFPDKVTVDEVATVAADTNYLPSADEITRAAQRGSRAHGPKLKLTRNDSGGWTFTLQYHVPYDALPPDLLQKIQPSSTNKVSTSRFFDLVPEAHAQAQGGEITGESVISVIANYTAEAYKDMDWANIHSYSQLQHELEGADNWKSLGADVPLALFDFLEDMGQLKGWNQQLSELEDCAKNPTNPLSQKASQGPNYQKDVMDQLQAADGDVNSTIVPTLASDAAGYLSHFLPFGGGAVTALVFSTQDEAVSEYANERIEEAGRYIVPCKTPIMLPTDLRPMHGTLEYKFNKNTGLRQETHVGEGEFDMNIMLGGLYGEAPGKLKIEIKETSDKPPCPGGQYQMKAGDAAHITATGGTALTSGVIELHLNGDLNVHEQGPVPEATHCVDQSRDSVQYFGYACRFTDIDFVHGGKFSTFASGEQGYGTCVIELSRK